MATSRDDSTAHQALSASLNKALRALYAVPREDFIAQRSVLAVALEARGKKAEAKTLKAAPKPSVLVAAANALTRAAPGEVQGLLDSTAALLRAHNQVVAGHKDVPLKAAMEAERSALKALLARRPKEVSATLGPSLAALLTGAARAGPAWQAQLREGRMTRVPDVESLDLPVRGAGGRAPRPHVFAKAAAGKNRRAVRSSARALRQKQTREAAEVRARERKERAELRRQAAARSKLERALQQADAEVARTGKMLEAARRASERAQRLQEVLHAQLLAMTAPSSTMDRSAKKTQAARLPKFSV